MVEAFTKKPRAHRKVIRKVLKKKWFGWLQSQQDANSVASRARLSPHMVVMEWLEVTNDSVNQYLDWYVTAFFLHPARAVTLPGPPQTQRYPAHSHPHSYHPVHFI